MFGFFKSKKMREREEADGVIQEVYTYYTIAKKTYPDKREIFYLALTWALFAKFNYPEKYQSYDLAGLVSLALGVVSLPSRLAPPDSIRAFAIYMVHKAHLPVPDDYESELGQLLSKLDVSLESAEQDTKADFEYFNSVKSELVGLSELPK